MIHKLTQAMIRWMSRVITQPRDELDRWQRAARFAYDLAIYGGRQLRHDRAPQMAAALAFRTLFALVPLGRDSYCNHVQLARFIRNKKSDTSPHPPALLKQLRAIGWVGLREKECHCKKRHNGHDAHGDHELDEA